MSKTDENYKTDKQLAEMYRGEVNNVTVKSVQKVLRKMEDDPVGFNFIAYVGGRTTDPQAFAAFTRYLKRTARMSRKPKFEYAKTT